MLLRKRQGTLCHALQQQPRVHTGIQEMTRRYQDFRQFAATARDQGEMSSLARLARRFSSTDRLEGHRPAAAATAEALATAEGDYAGLIQACQQCAVLQFPLSDTILAHQH